MDATLPGFEHTEEDKPAEKLKAVDDDSIKYSIAMSLEALHPALQSNQFKNFRDPGNVGSIGWVSSIGPKGKVAESEEEKQKLLEESNYGNLRLQTERDLFDIAPKEPGSKRPIYGLMRPEGDDDFKSNMTDYYGKAIVDIKKPTNPDAKVTTSDGDSVNHYSYLRGGDKEGIQDYKENAITHHSEATSEMAKDRADNMSFMELQWHEGAKPKPKKDIERVTLLGRAHKELAVVDGVVQKFDVENEHAKAQGEADELRNSGLKAPVTSEVHYRYQEPGLFENLPDAKANRWTGDIVKDVSRREV